MTLTQKNRNLRINTKLGENALILTGITLNESISAPFSYWLDLVSERSDISADDIVSTNVTFSLGLANGEVRYFNGQVNAFMQAHASGNDNAERSTYGYRAEIVPWFVSLFRTSNCRVFQKKTVPEIIEQIFTERELRDYELKLNATYNPRDYCVQYRESDYDFIVRLMAYEGIFYFFKHEDGHHKMIIGDSADAFDPCPHQETARFVPTAASGVSEDEVITELHEAAAPPSGRYVVNDYNFETPTTDLSSQEDSVCSLGQACDEIYEFPAVYNTKADGERIARIRIQQQEVQAKTISGTSYCRPFACGHQFNLEGHPNAAMNIAYLLTEVSGSFTEPAGGTGDAAPDRYENQFSFIPMDVPYRPPLINSKPMIQGIQSAFVVGPAGEEIYTDAYGRIKIQFHWDRYGEKNEDSSCFVRVAQSLAGPGFGTVFLPRIGQEVIVSFLEGDPDRPVVTGCLYNANNMPPYELPNHQNISTVKTRSTPNQSNDKYNELRFDDSDGNEQIFLHAQGCMDTIVNGSWRQTVGNSKLETIKGYRNIKTDRNDLLKVGENYGVSVPNGNVQITAGQDMLLLNQGDMELCSTGTQNIGSHSETIINATSGICLCVDASNFITIDASGVTIKGTQVLINSGGSHITYNQLTENSWGDPEEACSGRPPQESDPEEGQMTQVSRESHSVESVTLPPQASNAEIARQNPQGEAAPQAGPSHEAQHAAPDRAAAGSAAQSPQQDNRTLELGEAERIDPPEQGNQTLELGEAERIDPPEQGNQTLELGEAERIDPDSGSTGSGG